MNRILRPALLAIVVLGVPQTSRAAFVMYTAILNGPAESPPNSSPGTGIAQVDIDTVLDTMRVRVSFSGLSSGTTASHIHSATAVPFAGTSGVATTTPTFANFPLGVTFGTYDMTLDMTKASSYNPAFVTANGGTTAAAEAALFASFAAGTSYLNIHTANFPSGEIRGFLVPSAVPEPSSLALCGIAGAIALVVARVRRPPAG